MSLFPDHFKFFVRAGEESGSSESGSEKGDDEKSVHDDEEPEVERERPEDARYIVETYDPIIVTVHQVFPFDVRYTTITNTDFHDMTLINTPI